METKIAKIIEIIPDVIKNTKLNISIEGWPAFATVFTLCGTSIIFYSVKVKQSNKIPVNTPIPQSSSLKAV